jgi:hypothetical protein
VPKTEPLPDRREPTGHERTPEALGYQELSGGEFLYRLSPKKRTRLRREYNPSPFGKRITAMGYPLDETRKYRKGLQVAGEE